ncbi:MAG TPA: hypothetical protein PLS50_08785, partial [Candidatus Dojkabacteria bacterium]|nr:hypothetical protein [Candidatus Dojkabacteria bacterium]
MLVIFIYYIMLTIFCTSCRKLVEVSPPTNSITTSQAFSTDELARAAVMGVYHKMINASGDNFSNGVITLYCGATADEVEFFSSGVQDDIQFQLNNLTATNSKIANNFWGYGFSILYAANSIIDGLRNSVNVSDSVKIQLIAQA